MASSFSSLSYEQQQALLNGPALESPNGQYNFNNPSNLNTAGRVVVSLALAITTLFVLIRFYVRAFVVKRLRLEDYLLAAGFGIFVGTCYVVYDLIANVGLFVHQWDIRFGDLPQFLYAYHLCANLYSAHILASKAAILLEWIHIFVPIGTRNAFYWACQCLLWINILFYSSSIIVANLICHPFELIWNKTLLGTCIDAKVIEVVSAALNLASDLIILILPQRVIWGLHMQTRRKVGVSVIFAIGLLAITAAAFRLQSATLYYSSEDATYVSSTLILWSLVEMTSLFLILSVPSVPKALHHSKILQFIKTFVGTWQKGGPQPSSHEPHTHWPAPHGKAAIHHGQYSEIQDTATSTLLGQPSITLGTDTKSNDNLNGIMRTSEITRKPENISSSTLQDQEFLKTHPWALGASQSY